MRKIYSIVSLNQEIQTKFPVVFKAFSLLILSGIKPGFPIKPAIKLPRLSSGKSFFQVKLFLLLVLFFPILLGSCATSKLGSSGQKKIAGKTVVIVGASSGFGRGVAEQLGAYNANVVIAARRTALLEEVANKVRANGGKALVVTSDITKPEDIRRLTETTLSEFGKIDVWINMAGVGAFGRFWEIPIEDQARIVDINVKGVIYGSHAAIKQFRTQGYGVLINVGSVESNVPLAYHATYGSTKGAVKNFGNALSQELRLNGNKEIRVVTVEPWAADTPFWGHGANYTGRTPRMAIMDPPQKVVNATIRACLRGRHELPVGWKAKSAWISHHLFPRLTDRIAANVVHKSQMKNAPTGVAPHSVAAFEPMESGRGIDDGVKKRMHEENRQRKEKKK